MRPRNIIIYPKTRRGMRSTAEKWGVPQCKPNEREEKLLLVLGTGRCGTTTLYQMLKRSGFQVGHEKVGPHGVVSHYFCVDSDWHPMAPWQKNKGKKHVGERRSDFVFQNTWHVVRHPLKVIPSMVKIFGGLDWEYYEANGVIPIREPAMLRAMHAYLNINLLCEVQTDIRFKIENMCETKWRELMTGIGYWSDSDSEYPGTLRANKGTGFREAAKVTWSDLAQYDPALTRDLRAMAKRYGYSEV